MMATQTTVNLEARVTLGIQKGAYKPDGMDTIERNSVIGDRGCIGLAWTKHIYYYRRQTHHL